MPPSRRKYALVALLSNTIPRKGNSPRGEDAPAAPESRESAEDAQEKRKIIESLIAPTRNGSASPEAIRKLEKEVAAVPLSVFQAIRKFGVKIVVTHGGKSREIHGKHGITIAREPGESLLDTGTLPEANPGEYASPKMLAMAVHLRDCITDTEWHYDKKLLSTRNKMAKAAPESGEYREAKSLYTRLKFFKESRINLIAGKETGHKLAVSSWEERYDASCDTLGDLAAARGASTADERNEYAGIVAKLNPKIFRDGGENPETISLAKAGKRSIVIPDFSYVKEPATGKTLRLDADTRESVNKWEKPDRAHYGSVAKGMYVSNFKTLYLREGEIGALQDGNSESIHEIGHAYADALRALEPAAYKAFRAAAAREFRWASRHNKFVTDYSSEMEEEFIAEYFAAYFSPQNAPLLHSIHESWYGVMKTFINSPQKLAKD